MKPYLLGKQTHYLFFFFICLLFSKPLKSQDLSPKYDGKSIKYTILVNLSRYLEVENNIDNRPIYTPQNITSGKIGILKGENYNHTLIPEVTEYETSAEMVADLNRHNIDAMACDTAMSRELQILSNNLSRSTPNTVFMSTFGIKKDSELHSYLDDIQQQSYFDAEPRKWILLRYIFGYSLEEPPEGGKELKAAMQLTHPVYSFRDQNNNNKAIGVDMKILYDFAKANNYTVTLLEVNSYDEQVEMLKNGSADIAGGSFVLKTDSEYTNYIDYINLHIIGTEFLLRYENTAASTKWSKFYEKWEDLDAQVLGMIYSTNFVDISNENFQNLKPFNCSDIFNCFEHLCVGDIEGFIVDEILAEFTSSVFSRITYFTHDFYNNEYGLGFKKTDTDLLNEFNEFLSEIDTQTIHDQWKSNPLGMTVDRDLDTNAERTLTAAFYITVRSLTYRTGEEFSGYEVDLVYRFAKAKGYNLQVIACTLGERMTLLQENKADITGGTFTINEERSNIINFSKTIYEGGTVLCVRPDLKKDEIHLSVIGDNYDTKSNNTADIKVKFKNSKEIKNSKCVFPENYNDTIILNCEITDLSGVDPYSEGFTLDSTNDSIKLVYSSLRIDNLLNSNSLFNEEITANKTTEPINSDSSDTNDTNDKSNYTYYKRHSDGLSIGAIVGIVVPTGVVLIGATALAFSLRGSNAATTVASPSLGGESVKAPMPV